MNMYLIVSLVYSSTKLKNASMAYLTCSLCTIRHVYNFLFPINHRLPIFNLISFKLYRIQIEILPVEDLNTLFGHNPSSFLSVLSVSLPISLYSFSLLFLVMKIGNFCMKKYKTKNKQTIIPKHIMSIL